MKKFLQSQFLVPTLREVPSDAEVVSHQLMLRAGMIRKLAAGIYQALPMGLRVQRNVENIIRSEMNRAGAQEVQMPLVLPDELWRESGRFEKYGPELGRWRDRHDRGFILGPTHEEAVCDIVRKTVRSYKELPLNLYQIHTKFRDEVRPRFGVMRGREFIMKDAYSFHLSDEDLDNTYEIMAETYKAIFTAAQLDFAVVDADSGNIGGSRSQEFMVLASSGEDAIASCHNCGYAANLEKATYSPPKPATNRGTATRVHTPGQKSISEVSQFLQVSAADCMKCLLYETNVGYVMVVIAGNRQVQDVKLQSELKADWVRPVDEAQMDSIGAKTGFIGPIDFPSPLPLYVDISARPIENGVSGANEIDWHFTGVSYADLPDHTVVDVGCVESGDSCPRCGDSMQIARGIEVGHIFKLGRRYSESMDVQVLDETGQPRILTMGCYGIGVTRTVAACIEQNHDERGIVWPWKLAPWHVHILLLDPENEQAIEICDSILEDPAIHHALVDNRNERPGVKFNDADLIGCPLQIILGAKGLAKGIVEYKIRKTGERGEMKLDDTTSLRSQLSALLDRVQNQ